ncbi:MAG: M20/M25/M40 family metallo-hydrolase [Spirochaetes bacterium]|nr:M20/M25/M40 family metallo-hydrolase [Spirochaetota bacterium]
MHEAVDILSRYIRINTTNPPGNEAAGARFLADIFEREGIEYRTYESDPGRVSIRAVIHGSGAKEPLILLNHMDVVPADPAGFSFDPFGGDVRDGYVCGRGALDMKGIAVMQFMAFLALKRSGARPCRDLIFLATADEEEGGGKGGEFLLENHFDDFRAGVVLNEGGYGIAGMVPDRVAMLIAPAEKGPCWLRLTRRGVPGHGSAPHAQNALERMTRALGRLLAADLPVIITPTTAAYFRDLASVWKFLAPYAEDGRPETLARLLGESGLLGIPALNAMVRNTISLNMLASGSKINMIPDFAEAKLDIRLIPGQKVGDFISFVKETLADDEIMIEPILAADASASAIDTDDFIVLRDALQEHFPGSLVLLSLLSGFSDSRFFRERGIPVYGFCPIVITMDELSTIHGNDERISVGALARGCEVYEDVVRRLCK